MMAWQAVKEVPRVIRENEAMDVCKDKRYRLIALRISRGRISLTVRSRCPNRVTVRNVVPKMRFGSQASVQGPFAACLLEMARRMARIKKLISSAASARCIHPPRPWQKSHLLRRANHL